MATLETPALEEAECRLEQRILVAAPTGRDAGILCQITREAGFESLVSTQPEELCRAIDKGAPTAILAQEALSKEMCRALTETLSRQPEWSDFPLIILAAPASVQDGQGRWANLFKSSAHVVVLERPVRKVTLVSTVQAAVQSRTRQYQVRDELLERRRTEKALRESETKYRRLFEDNIIGMVVADEEKGIFEANERFLSTIGYTREEFEAGAFDWWTNTPPEHHRKDEEALRKLREKSFFEPFQKEFVRKNGTRLPFLLGGTRIAVEPLTWMCFVLDLTELKQAEDALKALNQTLEEQVAARTAQLQRQNARLRKLASQLTEAEERERRKLAQTLHDGLQQLLIAGKVQLSLSRSGRAGAIKRAEKFLDEAIAASRSLSYELSPPALRTSDLPKALEWLAAWFQKNHRFNVALTVSNGFPPLPESIKTLLFNAVRELLLNALKHSGSTTASVVLETKQPNYVCIRVGDDGKGFDPGKIAPQGEEMHGLGLFSIRERV
ncbi:MAG: PAS domain S-box protein, partial [Candidatus Hydrogenedentota bacterium]